MKYILTCNICGHTCRVRGSYDPSVNAIELDDNDRGWNDQCEHYGEYTITDEDDDGFVESYETTDHGDSVYPR